MNDISRTADEGGLERCTCCGQVLAASLILSALQDGKEIVECLFCLAEKKLIHV